MTLAPAAPELTQSVSCRACKSTKPAKVFRGPRGLCRRCGACGLIRAGEGLDSYHDRAFYEAGYYENLSAIKPDLERARTSLYRKFLGKIQNLRRTARILDVGCGYGDFLGLAQAQGWEAWGIEPSRDACRQAADQFGDRISPGGLEDADFPEAHFDVVTLWNVLDYLPDPFTALERIFKWIRPGGLLYIRTPNADFHYGAFRTYQKLEPILSRLGWKKNPAVFIQFDFTRRSLLRAVRAAGFIRPEARNADLTSGDPYKITSARFLMTLAKGILRASAAVISGLTFGKVLASSTLTLSARKPEASRPGAKPKTRLRIILKSVLLHVLAVLGYLSLIPIFRKIFIRVRRWPVLLYHGIDSRFEGEMTVAVTQFDEQMSFLKKHFDVASLEEGIGRLKEGGPSVSPFVSVTFDDGYANNYTHAFPVLQKHAIPAAVFLLAGGPDSSGKVQHLGVDTLYETSLLSPEQVRAMKKGCVRFFSHGFSHRALNRLSFDEVRHEIAASKPAIEALAGDHPAYFSYPYGTLEDFTRREEVLVRQAGYRAAFSAVYGVNGPSENLFALKRISLDASDTVFTLRAKLNGALWPLGIFQRRGVRRLIRALHHRFWGDPAPVRAPEHLLISVDFPPHTDGVSTISREVSARIAWEGDELSVVGPKSQGDTEHDRDQPYRVTRVPGYEWGYARFFPVLGASVRLFLTRPIRKIYAMNIAYGGIMAWAFSFFRRLDYLIFAYGYEFEKIKTNALLRTLYLAIYKRAKGIITCGEEVKRRLVRFGVESSRITVVHPAVDLSYYYPCEVPEAYKVRHGLAGRRVLLSVGRLVERKGHDMVFKALPAVIRRFPDVLYCIVGAGEFEAALREKVREGGLEGYVKFMGRLPDEDLRMLYNVCEFSMMPSREVHADGHIEGFGIVFLEANACGKPGIGGNSGGVPEALAHGVSGYLVDPSTHEELQARMLEMLENPEETRRLGNRAREWVRETFSWERYARRVREIMRDQGASR